MQRPQESQQVLQEHPDLEAEITLLSPQDFSEHDWALTDREFAVSEVDLMPNFPSPAAIRQLLDHYDNKIAGLMVWLDSEQNAYRRLVLPLAQRQPALMLSILAISAKHLSATSKVESSFPKSACDAALLMITGKVQQLTSRLAQGHDLSSEMDTETAEWMLASMLTLWDYETIGSESMDWQSHRQAARTLVDALGTANRRNNELYDFLRYQLSIFDVFACTTTFDPSIIENVILPEPDRSEVLFSEYLRIIHRVTARSREMEQISSPLANGAPSTHPTSKALRDDFEVARGLTLMAAGRLHITHESRRRDLIRLVDIYNHAGLLYSYRCLNFLNQEFVNVKYSKIRLVEAFDDLEDITAWIQNFPWPVFILGTECYSDQPRQASVRTMYQTIIENTGFNHYGLVLQFLEEYWAGDRADWTGRAREWESQGKQLLAV